MKKIVLASVAALAVATPAFAQDFTGVRFEGRVGWDRVSGELSYDDGTIETSDDDHEDGIGYGAEVGYDVQMGPNFVLGTYAGLDFSTADVCGEVFGEDEGCVEAGRNITVGVRAGTAVGHALLYAKGGYSNGQIKMSYEDFEDIIEDFSFSEERDGFHFGAGAEFNFGTNAYGKIEYVHTLYSGYEYEEAGETLGIDASRHQVLAGIGFRF